MMKDYFLMAISSIRHRSMRSWLTMIGIFVGIAAVVSLISVGQGMQTAIEAQFEDMGVNILLVQPLGAGFLTSGDDNPAQLTEEDEDRVKKTKGVLETAGFVFRSGRIDYKDDVNFQFISGLPSDDPDKLRLAQKVNVLKIIEGRNLEPGDKFKAVAGYSYTIKDEVFPKVAGPGSKLKINGVGFEIIGILQKTGSPTDDKGLIIPLDVAEDVLEIPGEEGNRNRDMIVAEISLGMDPEIVAESVHRHLMKFRNLDDGEEDFQVETADQLLGSFNSILAVVQAVLIGIAAISLLVGGIGITNTMYTAVLERTKEIGIMKAIGARNSDVLLIFLIESGTLGLIGGGLGVLIGYGISSMVTVALKSVMLDTYIQTFFPPWLIFGALGFSFIVGTLSGTLPAIQASKMNPVDALRYE